MSIPSINPDPAASAAQGAVSSTQAALPAATPPASQPANPGSGATTTLSPLAQNLGGGGKPGTSSLTTQPIPGDPETPSDSVKNIQWNTLGTVKLQGGVTVTAKYDPNDPNSKAAAQAVLDSAPNDLNQLGQIFGISPDKLASKNWEVDVTNQALNDNGAYGALHGFGDGADGTHVYANDFVVPDTTDAQGNPVYATPGLFAAEATETFEAAKNNGWQEADTNGEGLSRSLAFTLHPESASSLGQGGVEQGWWQGLGTQPNYTNYVAKNAGPFVGADGKTYNGDNNQNSNGEATLFLYYEHDVLGKSWAQIAQTGGNTLADNYNKLTGQHLDGNTIENNFIAALSQHQSSPDNGSQLNLPDDGGTYPPYDPFAPPLIA